MEGKCSLCPRQCGSRRSSEHGEGFCGEGFTIRAARAAAHFWEEPCISGISGSGAIFFSGCNLGCIFCQNKMLSRDHFGKQITAERLREIYFELIDFGVHNINLVTPTHFVPEIRKSLLEPLPVPVVYNCGGYESVQTLKSLEGLIDIYMPDFKYSDSTLAEKYSFAPDYPTVCRDALREMLRQTGRYRLDDEGMMQSGVLIRHLILPGNVENSLGVIDAITDDFRADDILFSLMRQYTPPAQPLPYEELNRRVTDEEYNSVLDYMYLCGIENGYVQDSSSAEWEYLPDFNLEGI